MCPQNQWQTSEKCSTLQLDFVCVAGQYRVGKLLGSGGSGSVYLGRDIRIGTEIALKIGRADHLPSRLSHEYDVYSALGACAGVTPVHWYGKEGLYEVIILDHLGTSLGDLIDEEQVEQSKTFQYTCQMLSAIELLHTRHYIHRDIKPDNFMVRAGHPHTAVFLIDFGLAWLFRNPATYLHIPYSKDHLIVRTLPFTSINGQQGHAQSHCDDLESLVYTIIFSAHGNLPWMTTSAYSDPMAVLQKKKSVTAEELCKGLPTPFCNFVTYVCSLGFDKKPDYQYLHSILSRCSAAEADHPGEALPSPTLSIVSPGHEPVSSDWV
ncbi:kinase-like protein [Lactarius deliciosus]|nr:kinase-like protein [Lactarius deliciosus]